MYIVLASFILWEIVQLSVRFIDVHPSSWGKGPVGKLLGTYIVSSTGQGDSTAVSGMVQGQVFLDATPLVLGFNKDSHHPDRGKNFLADPEARSSPPVR
ncbi:MAG: hypothetical protein HQK59_13250 [Deltaproteobacteria bacterium]|nr:hypothetical protein [Deltaproteobacteria bacterium]